MNTDECPTLELPCLDHLDAYALAPERFETWTVLYQSDVAVVVCRCPDCLSSLPIEVIL